jgi:hypothetical protein
MGRERRRQLGLSQFSSPSVVSINANKFLCAFVVTAPFATTLKRNEVRRTKGILDRTRGQFTTEELKSISDQAIDEIRRNAIQEPENQEKLCPVKEKNKGIPHLFSA